MKKELLLKRVVGTIVFLIISVIGMAQDRQVTGIVRDDKSSPLEGATVSVKNSTKNTLTKADGKFQISVPNGKITLRISFVGYEATTITVAENQTNVIVKMDAASTNKMADVVVVGYQKQSLRKTTSAVQVISGREIENLPAPSFDQLLQGKVSGVNIQNFSGEPGVRNTFVVRGNSNISTNLNDAVDDGRKHDGTDEARTLSTPLYVIDGIPLSINDIEGVASSGTNFLAGININDIESIVVQKDAAATAAWGSRGANGVIVIKTKRGRTGKPQVRVSYYTGITQKPKLLRTVAGGRRKSPEDWFVK